MRLNISLKVFRDDKFIYDLTYGNSWKIIVNQFRRDNYNLQSEKSFSLKQFVAGGTMITTKNHKYFVLEWNQTFYEFNSNGGFGEERKFGSISYKKRYSILSIPKTFINNDSTKILIVYYALDKVNKSKAFKVFNVKHSIPYKSK